MSNNQVDPVDIEFLLKNTNFKEEAAKMKAEISGVTDTVQKASENMLASMNYFSDLSAKGMKASISEQKLVIEELKQKLKELRDLGSNQTGRQKSDTNIIINRTAAELKGEQASLLEMKKIQTAASNEAMLAKEASAAANKVEAESQVPIIGGLWKWAVGLATVSAALKIGKEILESTEGSAKQFKFAIAGAEEGLSFFYKTVRTGEWSNFFTNMDRAIKAGHDYAAAMHEAEEAGWAQSMKESAMLKENAQLEIDLRDRTLTPEQNVAAGKKRIANEEELAKGRIEVAQIVLDAATKRAVERSGIAAEDLKKVLNQVDKTTTKIQAEEYNKTRDVIANTGLTPAEVQRSKAPWLVAYRDAAPEVKLYADALRGYGKLKEDMILGYVDAVNKFNEADASALTGTKKLRTMLSSREVEIQTAAEEAEKKRKEAAELENRIKATKEAMNHASGPELKDLADKLILLEKELALRKQIIELENQKAWRSQFDNTPMSEITSIGPKPIQQLGQSKVVTEMNPNTGLYQKYVYEITAFDKTGPVWTKVKAEFSDLKKFEKEKNKEGVKDQEKLDKEKKKRQEEYFRQGLEFMDAMIQKYGEELGLTEDQVGLISSLAKGDYGRAAFEMFTIVSKMFKSSKESILDYYTSLNESINKVVDSVSLINSTLANMGKGSSIAGIAILQSELVKLTNDAARLNDQLKITSSDDERRRGTTDQGATTTVDGSLEGTKERIRATVSLIQQTEYLNEQILILSNKLLDPNLTEEQRQSIELVLKGYNDIINSIDSSIQDITGTSINELSNSLIDAFLSGEDAADSWGKKVNDIIKNIVKNQLIAQLLTKPITEAIQTLIADTEGGLTTDEASKFKKTMDLIYTNSSPAISAAIDALKRSGIDITGTNASTSSKGVSASATEDTMSAFLGQIYAVRVDIKSILLGLASGRDDVTENLKYMKEIAANTSYNKELVTIRDEMKEMNKTLKDRL